MKPVGIGAEPLHSIPLASGESTRLTVVDRLRGWQVLAEVNDAERLGAPQRRHLVGLRAHGQCRLPLLLGGTPPRAPPTGLSGRHPAPMPATGW